MLLIGSMLSLFMLLSAWTSPFAPSWVAEAEKKHGRAALVAVPALVGLGALTDAPVDWLNAQPASVQAGFYAGAAILEAANLRRLDRGFALRAGEVPGKVLPGPPPPETLERLENGAGRAAMLVAVGWLAASLRG